MRKVIQIIGHHLENNASTQANSVLYALCNDGTIWEMWGHRPWTQVTEIPQVASHAP